MKLNAFTVCAMNPNDTPIAPLPHEGLGANSPATGHYCATQSTGRVGFIHLPRAEGFASKTPHLGLRVWRRGLLAAWALCAWQSAAGQALPAPAATPETITVRGVVMDDSLNVPIPGMWLYLNDTKYGAITDAQGEFTFSFPTAWRPVRGGMLTIKVATIPYTFQPMHVPLDWRTYDSATPLTLRLASAPGRGRPNLHGSILMAPPVPPPVYPPRSHMGRP